MARTFYAQSDRHEPTMTVGALIEHLKKFDPAAPVIFKSPEFGCFGPDTEYSLDTVAAVSLDREEMHFPAGKTEDEETGEEIEYEAHTEVSHAWSGVVIG